MTDTTSRTFTILLVDDNAIQAATRQTILKRAGYLVIPVLDPARALEQFEASSFTSPIDLVITDHLMPIMNGTEFVKRLRELQPALPVLVITGLEDAQPEYRGLNVHFYRKPLPPQEMLHAVAQALQQATAVQESPDIRA